MMADAFDAVKKAWQREMFLEFSRDFTIKDGDVSIQHGDFTIKKHESTVKHCDLTQILGFHQHT